LQVEHTEVVDVIVGQPGFGGAVVPGGGVMVDGGGSTGPHPGPSARIGVRSAARARTTSDFMIPC